MIKIVSVEQMREIERASDAEGISYAQMMQQAGSAVADVVTLLLGDDPSTKQIAVLVGPGNNGGDGLVAARILKEKFGAQVGVYLLRSRSDDDPNFVAALDAGISLAKVADDQDWQILENLVASADVVIDALLGTGARLPIEGDLSELLEHVSHALNQVESRQSLVWPAMPLPNQQMHPAIVAVDCPSGLNADTGELDSAALSADFTVTFAAAKKGHLTFPGAGAVGQLVVADIGTPEHLLKDIKTELASASDILAMLPKRPQDGHKGTFGRAIVIAGSINYTGAAMLSGAAAYRAGAGLVTLAVPQAIYPILATQIPEATWLLLPHDMGVLNRAAADVFADEAGAFEALLIGPGLGRDAKTGEFVWGLLTGQPQAKRAAIGFGSSTTQERTSSNSQLPEKLIIDADGLNLLSERAEWWKYLPPNTVLTPHPGEMSRLSGLSIAEITENRFEVARAKAEEWGVVLVLKGAFTLVTAPDGRVIATPFVTDALATAGTGDVLAGCIAGLLAQGIAPFEAAICATYVHGLAGTLAGQGGSRSVIATDVLALLGAAFASIEEES
jgi:ADP-dependent NAD(P)H-hydrate dehydratase / NAD(P)H-hydrate epimerase